MESCKPYIILNAAMSLDGKIASKCNDARLSSIKDLTRVHQLRSKVDAIMVGINTVMADDPLLTARYGYNAQPTRIIIDSNARIRRDSRIVKSSKEIKTIVVVSDAAKDNNLSSYGIEVIPVGKEKVDLRGLMPILYAKGIRKVLLEGGGELNWSMLSNRLVDEVIVTVEPVIVGGRDAKTLVEGEGFAKIDNAIRLILRDISKIDDEVVLRYNIIY